MIMNHNVDCKYLYTNYQSDFLPNWKKFVKLEMLLDSHRFLIFNQAVDFFVILKTIKCSK